MKKRYFYVVASFMRKDIANTWRKVDFTIMKDDGSALFPLMEAIKVINEGYSEIADFNLGQDKSLKKTDETIRSFSSFVKKINDDNVRLFQHFEERLVSRPSYLSPEEKKHFKEYMQSCARGYTFISNMPNKMDLDFVCVEDVDKALEFVGRDQWDSLYIKCPSEEEYANGQNTERNQ